MRVTVVGAGISGVACARALRSAGAAVTVVDRSGVGGRMLSRRLGDGRTVDLGASYLTATDPGFAAIVRDWRSRGLAREWTDTFAVAGPDGLRARAAGPMRYAAPAGLSALVVDLAAGLDVGVANLSTVDDLDQDAVVLAMPDPAAAALLAEPPGELTGSEWEPVTAAVLRYPDRRWPPDLHGAFVNDDEVLAFVADDGDRRGDGAPVLVAHTTGRFARRRDGEVSTVITAVHRALEIGGTDPPEVLLVHQWQQARPVTTQGREYWLRDGIGICGDAWSDQPRVQSAWLSGHALGERLSQGL